MKSFPHILSFFCSKVEDKVNSCTPIDQWRSLPLDSWAFLTNAFLLSPINIIAVHPKLTLIKSAFRCRYLLGSLTNFAGSILRYVTFVCAVWAIKINPPDTVLGSSPGGLLSTQSRAGLCRNHRDRTQRLKVSLFISWVDFHQPHTI